MSSPLCSRTSPCARSATALVRSGANAGSSATIYSPATRSGVRRNRASLPVGSSAEDTGGWPASNVTATSAKTRFDKHASKQGSAVWNGRAGVCDGPAWGGAGCRGSRRYRQPLATRRKERILPARGMPCCSSTPRTSAAPARLSTASSGSAFGPSGRSGLSSRKPAPPTRSRRHHRRAHFTDARTPLPAQPPIPASRAREAAARPDRRPARAAGRFNARRTRFPRTHAVGRRGA